MYFRFYPLRFEFVATTPLFFPPEKAANVLRGALGLTLNCLDVESEQIFEPHVSAAMPSGLADPPRPFVFRARHLNGRKIHGGEPFSVGMNFFLLQPVLIEHLVSAFQTLSSNGFGPGRGKAQLQRVTSGTQVILGGDSQAILAYPEPLCLDLRPAASGPARVRIDFLTPTELRQNQKALDKPEFPFLFARIRDRIATLSRLYASNPLVFDYRESNERAAQVRMTSCSCVHHEIQRRSTRTGQTHDIGGFVGAAEYEGDLKEFLPWLEVSQWTGVGRHSVWGNGEISIHALR